MRRDVAEIVAMDSRTTRIERVGMSQPPTRPHIYDCGHLTDLNAIECVGEEVWYRMDREAIELQERGDLRLPHPICAFLFRFHEGEKPPVINLVFVQQYDCVGPIDGAIYSRQPDLPHPMNLWVREPSSFRLEGRLINCETTTGISIEMRQEKVQDLASRASDVRVMLMLLNGRGPRSELEAEPRATRVARGMKAEPPPVQVIHVHKPQFIRPEGERDEPSKSGIVQRPHWKRGAWATRKKSGKVYWMPPRAVHGGGEHQIFRIETEDHRNVGEQHPWRRRSH